SVVATAHADGGCLAATIDVSARDLATNAPSPTEAPSRIATAAALVRQEVAVEMADAATPPDLGGELTRRASDPRDAAERAAWWSLAGSVEVEDDPRVGLTVGVAPPRDASAAMTPEAMTSVL